MTKLYQLLNEYGLPASQNEGEDLAIFQSIDDIENVISYWLSEGIIKSRKEVKIKELNTLEDIVCI